MKTEPNTPSPRRPKLIIEAVENGYMVYTAVSFDYNDSTQRRMYVFRSITELKDALDHLLTPGTLG